MTRVSRRALRAFFFFSRASRFSMTCRGAGRRPAQKKGDAAGQHACGGTGLGAYVCRHLSRLPAPTPLAQLSSRLLPFARPDSKL